MYDDEFELTFNLSDEDPAPVELPKAPAEEAEPEKPEPPTPAPDDEPTIVVPELGRKPAAEPVPKGSCRRRTDAPVAAGDQNAPAIARSRTRRRHLFGCRFFRLLRRLGRVRLRDRLRRRFFQHHHPGGFVHRSCCRFRLRLWHCGRFLRSLFRLRLLARQIERQFKFIFVQEYGPPVVFSAQQLCAVQEMFCRPSPPVSVHFFSGQSPALGVTGRCARWVSTKHH